MKTREFLTVPEAARILRLKPNSVYRLVARGKLPGARRFGGAIRISRSALMANDSEVAR